MFIPPRTYLRNDARIERSRETLNFWISGHDDNWEDTLYSPPPPPQIKINTMCGAVHRLLAKMTRVCQFGPGEKSGK